MYVCTYVYLYVYSPNTYVYICAVTLIGRRINYEGDCNGGWFCSLEQETMMQLMTMPCVHSSLSSLQTPAANPTAHSVVDGCVLAAADAEFLSDLKRLMARGGKRSLVFIRVGR